jgi:type IV pilus assembly protein PilV
MRKNDQEFGSRPEPLSWPAANRHPGQRGFTLLEVLVALVVLSFGLIGLAMLQTTSLRFNNDSYMRSQATFLAYDLVDRMRANITGAEAGNYCITNATSTTAPPGTPETCGADSTNGCADAKSLAEYDIAAWYDLQKKYLSPAASASSVSRVTKATAGKTVSVYTITMRWNERSTDIEQTWVIEL